MPRTIRLQMHHRGGTRGSRTGNRGPLARWGKDKSRGEGSRRVTENERRAADSLRASDLVLRAVSVVGLITVAFVLLLMLYPA